MEQTILTIYNRHTEACGSPAAVSNESPGVYVGYFENRYGEQWIVTYDRRTRTAKNPPGFGHAGRLREGMGTSFSGRARRGPRRVWGRPG